MKQTERIDVCYVVYPPTVMKDPSTGKLNGHMIDTLEAILKPINVKPVYHEQAWGTAVLGLKSGICDIVASAFFIKIPRAYSVAFTKPLFYVGDAALVRKNDNRFSSIWDADKKGVVVAVANGESGHEFVKENFKKADIRAIDVEGGDLSRVYLEVSSGRADIAITDAWNIKLYSEKHDDVKPLFIEKPFNMNPVAWAVRQDETEFMRFIENSLNALEANGKLKEFEKRYDAHWLHETKTYNVE
ncbi:MAG: amino acid ABC transporter substrate-binding protein [Candidatus Micrarchaeota archaeon]|nr:amino acid ABC transporter substrate-binding protein [Candidatus Micrarchaeota archaeon]